MTTPAVSVLVTAYNRERYIAASIESVLAQTRGDLEVLVTDNRSTDGTLEIARGYERVDPRVRVFANDRNLGQFGNRNHAASLARGRYLKFHDSDDLMYPHCLEVMVPLLGAYPTAGFGLSNGVAWPGGPVPMLLTPRQCYQREFLGAGLFGCGPAGALFRTEAFHALGGFDDYGAPSDAIFWMRACRRFSVVLFPADLFYYREHPGQLFQGAAAAREYATVPAHAWRALSALDCPLDPAEREQARRNVAFGAAKSVWRALRQRQVSLAIFRFSAAGLAPAEWLRYVRPPKRSPFAGTPAGPDGECPPPDWCRSLNAQHRP